MFHTEFLNFSGQFRSAEVPPLEAQQQYFSYRDACSDSIAKLFRACFCGVSHHYRVTCCKMGYRTDVSV